MICEWEKCVISLITKLNILEKLKKCELLKISV